MSNDYTFPSGTSSVNRVKEELPYGSTEGRNAPDRSVGVTVTSAFLFLAGGALSIGEVVLLCNLVANPRAFVQTFYWAAGWLIALVLLPFAVMFIPAAVGLWRLRKLGLGLAIISSVLWLLMGVFLAVGLGLLSDPLGLLSDQGLIFLPSMLGHLAVLLYLVRPKVRALFR
jgi:hypothetical protein